MLHSGLRQNHRSLHEYVRGDTAKKKKEQVVLNKAARNAFHQLKKSVMSAPVLAYQDPNGTRGCAVPETV